MLNGYKLRDQLIVGTGWHLVENAIPQNLIDQFNTRLSELVPCRGFTTAKSYIEGKLIRGIDSNNLSIWWSQQTSKWKEAQEIISIVERYVKSAMIAPTVYASDVVTISPGNNFINPHVDTPHRFDEWNYDTRLLAIQSIVALHDIDKNSGSTGLWSGSQSFQWPIQDCYKGMYNDDFIKNCVQPFMPKGSLLFYNARLMHSSMPNPSQTPRKALLVHHCEKSIIEKLSTVDNIWTTENS
jgi:hypothetical protein